MSVDDRLFAARVAAITEASRSRVDNLQRKLAEQQAGARTRGRDHLQRMMNLADSAIHEITAVAKRDHARERGPTSDVEHVRGLERGLYDRRQEEAPTAPAAPTRTRARDLLGDDESFFDRHWLH